MPELTTAWITLSATTKGMERDIRQAINRAERGAKITPEVDTAGLGREGERAGKNFAQRFDRASDNLGSGMAGRGKSAGTKIGNAFVGGFTAVLAGGALTSVAEAAVGSLRSILESGLDFSKTLNNFQGVTRATASEMAQMQQTARSLGSDTTLAGASATDAASAMTELAKAGFSVDQAMTAARGTLELATAGQIDAAKAAEIQSNAMNAFNLSATDAAHVADLFANAAVASSADIPDLGEALQQVGGIAQGFGENLDDTIAALGIFANAGIKGSDAGTLLKTTMQSITDQGNPAQGAIKNLGLELYKLNGQGQNQFVGFRELFRQLDEAKKRLNDPEMFQAQTNILFGSDAMRSAMLGNAADFDDMLTKLEHVGGAAELAGSQMQGLPGAVESFSNAVEGIKLGAFDAFGPGLAQGLSDFVNYLSDHKSEVIDFFVNLGDASITMAQVMIASFGQAAGIIRPFADLLGFDDTAKSLQFVFDASQQAFNGLETARTGMHQYADRAKEASQFTDALGKSVTTLKTVGDDVTIDVKDNTPEVRTKLETLGAHLEQMANDPTRLRIVSDTREAENKLNAYRQQQNGTPVDVPFTVHFDAGKSFLPEWFKYIGGTAGPAPMPVSILPSGLAPPPGRPGPGVQPSSPPSIAGIPFLPGRATGGPVFGAGTATSDSIPAMLSNGEHVWTAEEVRKAGGQAAMYRMRAAVRGFDTGGAAAGNSVLDLLTGKNGAPYLGTTPERAPVQGFLDGLYRSRQIIGTTYDWKSDPSGINPNFAIDTSATTFSQGHNPNDPTSPGYDPNSWGWGDVADGAVLDKGEINTLFGRNPNYNRRHISAHPELDPWHNLLNGYADGGAVGLPDAPGDYVVSPNNVMSALQFAQSVSGSQYSYGSAGPAMFDCSGFMSAIYGVVTGKSMPAGQRYFTTESDFSKLGFLPGYDANSPFNIGVHNGGGGKDSHMAGSLAGYNVESGGSAGITQIGGSAASPLDSQFENKYHLPGSMASMYGMSGQTGAGQYEVDPQAVFDAETSAIRARNDLQVQRMQLAELEAKGTATESQLVAARNDVAEQERDTQSAESKLAEAKQGKFKEAKSSKSGGGGPDASSFGSSLMSGIFESLGVPNFMNLMDTPNFKSGAALLNYGLGFLGGDSQGTDGGGGMNVAGINLPGISDFLKPIGPQALSPVDPNTTQHGAALGANPGPTFNVTATGMDPKAVVQTQQGAFNSAYRKSGLPAVKP